MGQPKHSYGARGLSPHGRGKRRGYHRYECPQRSIPARAGETIGGGRCLTRTAVYPRTGGGNGRYRFMTPGRQGLSPHGRGKRFRRVQSGERRRSIPARAGETLLPASWPARNTVYPRTGGGNANPRLILIGIKGLSPHGRGKRKCGTSLPALTRSIPARAGET